MKFIPVLLCLLLTTLGFSQQQRFVQTPQNTQELGRSSAYVGIATGINSYSGLLGLEAEVPLKDRISVFGVAGLGLWGYKFGGGAKFYLNKPQFGNSLSLGYTAALGFTEPLELTSTSTGNGTNTYFVKLSTASTINLMYHYTFRVGRGNKIGLGGGWAVAMQDQPYTVVASTTGANQLPQAEEFAMRIIQPGGFVFSLKFLFGID